MAKMLAMGIGRRRDGQAAEAESVVVGRVGDRNTVDGVRFGWWGEGKTERVDWEWQYCLIQKSPRVAGGVADDHGSGQPQQPQQSQQQTGGE